MKFIKSIKNDYGLKVSNNLNFQRNASQKDMHVCMVILVQYTDPIWFPRSSYTGIFEE